MPDIGASLREARMRAKVDISEIEAQTKIRAKYLRALENEEWDLLPGPTYVKSFLRTYAEALDLDAKLLVDEYKLRHERLSEVDLQPINAAAPGRERRRQTPTCRPGSSSPRSSPASSSSSTCSARPATIPPTKPRRRRHRPRGQRAGGTARDREARAPEDRQAPDRGDWARERLPEGRRPHARRRRDAAGRRSHEDVPCAALPAHAGQRLGDPANQRPPADRAPVAERHRDADHADPWSPAADGAEAPRLSLWSRTDERPRRHRRHRHRGADGACRDRNGPWLSERLLEQGADPVAIAVVGDRPQDILRALRFLASEGCALIVTSGGLGPTADDLTAEVVGRFQQREMVLDEPLEGRIAEILRPLMARWPDLDPEAVMLSNRKQAVIPSGAEILEPVGTAPGLVVTPAGGGASDGRRAARPAARAAADVAHGGHDEPGAAGGAQRRRRVPPRHAAPVRHPRVGDRGDAARRRRTRASRSSGSRSRPACGAARSRS